MAMNDDEGIPLFAFQDLDYIPYGFGSSTAPYIETAAGTMRAAAVLMRLGLRSSYDGTSTDQEVPRTVVCDLGCGDGYFLTGLLDHINVANSINVAHGVGIDYNADLIKSASEKSDLSGDNIQWLIYDFNDDADDLFNQLTVTYKITHVFIYLVPKQLAMLTVRRIITQLYESGVVVCCHKFFPEYLTPARRDRLMELVVYDENS